MPGLIDLRVLTMGLVTTGLESVFIIKYQLVSIIQ
jgi:hypothetical protein